MLGRLKRLHFKSLGGLLGYQERLAGEWAGVALCPPEDRRRAAALTKASLQPNKMSNRAPSSASKRSGLVSVAVLRATAAAAARRSGSGGECRPPPAPARREPPQLVGVEPDPMFPAEVDDDAALVSRSCGGPSAPGTPGTAGRTNPAPSRPAWPPRPAVRTWPRPVAVFRGSRPAVTIPGSPARPVRGILRGRARTPHTGRTRGPPRRRPRPADSRAGGRPGTPGMSWSSRRRCPPPGPAGFRSGGRSGPDHSRGRGSAGRRCPSPARAG